MRARTRSPGVRLRHGGFTLVELLVALALTLVIVTAAVATLIVSRRGFSTVDAVSQLDENARFTTEILRRTIAQAGFLDVAFATVGYLLLFDLVGFFVATALYLVAVMWIGGVRRPVFLGLLSLAISFAFSFFFMKLIYVALPLGEGPFARISLIVMKLVGAN